MHTRTFRFLPGEILEEELEARGMTQRELAARLGRPAQAINEIIKAKKSITPETAIGLGRVLGIEPHFWMNLEASYPHDTGAETGGGQSDSQCGMSRRLPHSGHAVESQHVVY